MASPCVDCGFTFRVGPGGERILSPAFEFLHLGRTVPQELGASADPLHVLDWPTVVENVNELEAGCDSAIRRVSSTVTAIDVTGWFHLGLGLQGESATNCVNAGDDQFLGGILIELDRGGVKTVISADIKDRDVCRAYSYACSIERRFEAGDLLRTYYYLDGVNATVSAITLPSSARNYFTVRNIRRA